MLTEKQGQQSRQIHGSPLTPQQVGARETKVLAGYLYHRIGLDRDETLAFRDFRLPQVGLFANFRAALSHKGLVAKDR